MSNEIIIARPYAKAAFEVAKSADMASWLNAIQLLNTVANDAKINEILNNPTVTPAERLTAIMQICDGYLDAAQCNFLKVLAENKRLFCLPAIYALFQDYYDTYQQIVEAEVFSAYPLSELQKQKLTASLEKKLNAKVQLVEKNDPSLIGGAFIRMGDRVIDGSISGRLQRLACHLNLKESLCQ